ncbi:MAG: fumarylacetoacetate hydrolase family protein [Melioribacteraceae bacterium]|nr:fumarylacetoacetate hydrolase family protein [Melioribacteraceae bacterium]MDD3557246.1 fumarylacetoacetate hydrolase family protein [Melioribacteraceae bacterium]
MKKIKLQPAQEEIEIGKIICVGRNYAKHAEELGNIVPENPLLFLKPSSVFIPSGEEITYPSYSNEMHHEVELVVLIGEEIKNADPKEAEDAILGYAVGLDMTLRDVQTKLKSKGHPWTLAKVFDGAGVVGEFISKNEYNYTGEENIKLWINDELKQSSQLKNMLTSPVNLIVYISTIMKLERGDLIFTGTPEGVGVVNKGDIITAEIEKCKKIETIVK